MRQRYEKFSEEYLKDVDAFQKLFLMEYDSGLSDDDKKNAEANTYKIAKEQLEQHSAVVLGLRDSIADAQLEGARLQGMAEALSDEARTGDLMGFLGQLEVLYRLCDADAELTTQLQMVNALAVYLEPQEMEARALPPSREAAKAWDVEEQVYLILEGARAKVADLQSVYAEMFEEQNYSMYLRGFIAYQSNRVALALAQYEAHVETKH